MFRPLLFFFKHTYTAPRYPPHHANFSFAEPCDDEHLLEEEEERDPVNGEVTFVSCARSRVRVGRVVADSGSPSGKRCAAQ